MHVCILICLRVKLKARNSESHTRWKLYKSLKHKETKRYRRKSTCLKKARCSLLANLVARPACHRTVIHFRGWCIVQSVPMKLLVLFRAVWCAGRRYMGVTRVWNLDELTRIIECPMESQWRRMALHGTH